MSSDMNADMIMRAYNILTGQEIESSIEDLPTQYNSLDKALEAEKEFNKCSQECQLNLKRKTLIDITEKKSISKGEIKSYLAVIGLKDEELSFIFGKNKHPEVYTVLVHQKPEHSLPMDQIS